MHKDFKIELLKSDSIDAQVNVFLSSFEIKKSFCEEKNIWISKHYRNPNGESLIFGVWDHDKLVSINAFLKQKFVIGGKHYSFLQSCDSGTLLEYRGRGIWKRLISYSLDYIKKTDSFDAIIGFPNYNNSYPGFLKMGWNDVSDMVNYIYPCKPKAFCEAVGLSKIFSWAISLFLTFKTMLSPKKTRARNTNSVDSSYTQTDGLLFTNDLLNWKASYNGVKVVCLEKGDSYKAYVCYREDIFKTTKTCNVCRIYSNEKFYKKEHALRDFIYYISHSEVDYAFFRIWVPSCADKKYVKKNTFFKSSHRNPFIIKWLRNEENIDWSFLSFMDLD